ncbi:MAG: caspase family protein [Gammaproteobacteria bacterium]
MIRIRSFRFTLNALIFLLLSATAPQQALAEKRIALVIGNSAYRDSPLTNPVNDAKDMSEALKEDGFEVSTFTDIDRKQMRDAIRDFGEGLRKADTGLFYFAGHGIQVQGRNYLVPLGADVHSADEVQDESIEAGSVLRKMESAGNRVNIVILDACRNNPFARSFRSLETGLARMDGPVGSFIAYATAPGSVAADGDGRNGLYTQYLLEALRQPGLSIEQMFKRVRSGVTTATQGQQIPWESSSLLGEFVFLPGAPKETDQPEPMPAPPPIAYKYLQVIANVPNADVMVNNVSRGVVGDDGVLNIANLTDDVADVTVRAEGYAPQHKQLRLRSGQWEQLNVTLQRGQPTQTEAVKAPAGLERKNVDLICIGGKRVLATTKIIAQDGDSEKIKRNTPVFRSAIIQAFKSYGLDFIDIDIASELTQQNVRNKRKVKALLVKHHPDYLLKAAVSMREMPIRQFKTNMKTVNAVITLELLDFAGKSVLATVSHTVNTAGLDPKQVIHKELEKALPDLSDGLMRQVCGIVNAGKP